MSFIQLLIIQLFIFAGLVFFMYRILTRHATRTTGHLQELSQDYMKKQEELNKRFEKVERDRQELLAKAREEAERLKAKTMEEAQKAKEALLEQARQQSEQIVQRAEKTRDALKRELAQEMQVRAVERACELIHKVLPDKLREEIHSSWLEELISGEFLELDRLRIPDDIREAKVSTAFALNPKQKDALSKRLREKLGRQVLLKEEIDQGIIAGLIVTIGSLVLDGSLGYKLRELAQGAKKPENE